MTETSLVLRHLTAPLRRRTAVLWGLTGLASAAFALSGAVWIARLGVVSSPVWVFWGWGGVLATLGLSAGAGVRALGAWRVEAVARRLEGTRGWRLGSLTSLIDPIGSHTSESLFRQADVQGATRVAAEGEGAFHRWRRRMDRGLVVRGAILLAAAAALGGASPFDAPGALVWHPAEAWDRLRAPVRVIPERLVVDAGESIAVTIRAPGGSQATVWSREPGAAWRGRTIPLDTAGTGRLVIGPLEADRLLRATSGGKASDTVRIAVRLPAFLGRLHLEARYPDYLGMDPEPLPVTGDTLLLPEGTVIYGRGDATTALGASRWRWTTGARSLQVDGTTFEGGFVPPQSGTYLLDLRTRDGEPLAGGATTLAVRIVADSAPVLDLPVPGRDTVTLREPEITLVVDARDDHGLAQVRLDVVRTRSGILDTSLVLPLPLPSPGSDRALLRIPFRPDLLHAQPGDTLRLTAVGVDRAPAPHTGRSKAYLLILPTDRLLRDDQRRTTEALQTGLDSLVRSSRALERQAEDLARQSLRRTGEPDPAASGRQLSFEEAKRAGALAENEEQLIQEADRLERSLSQLAEEARHAGIGDTALARQLAEVRDQLRRALSPELRQRLADLQQAITALDAERAQEAVKRLAEAQQALREAMERSRELFRRAAQEGELAALEREAADVANAERELARRFAAQDTAATGAQDALAARADSLAHGLDRASAQMDSASAQGAMQQGAARARAASQAMRRAATAGRTGQHNRAEQEAEVAAQALNEAEREVREQREAQQEAWRQQVLQALDRAVAEMSRLADRQMQVAEEIPRGAPVARLRGAQGSVEEGVAKLQDQVKAVSGQNALVSPRIAAALAAAQRNMAQVRDALSSASPNLRDAADQAGEAVDALNTAVYQILRSRGDVEGSSSGSGLAEALERMAQLAQQQGALSQESNGLLPMAGQAGMQQQLQQLAAMQRKMAQDLERLRAQGDLPNTGALAAEAEDLARRMEAGRLDRETVARQERLFRRMLDAGRTLQGEEKDEEKERQSESAKEQDLLRPPALDPRIRAPGMPWPSWEELLRYSPEERRLVADYFRRLHRPPLPLPSRGTP